MKRNKDEDWISAESSALVIPTADKWNEAYQKQTPCQAMELIQTYGERFTKHLK